MSDHNLPFVKSHSPKELRQNASRSKSIPSINLPRGYSKQRLVDSLSTLGVVLFFSQKLSFPVYTQQNGKFGFGIPRCS